MAGLLDPGNGGASNPNYRERGARYDHIWKLSSKTGQQKRLSIIFPLSKDAGIPSGATSTAPLDPAGATKAATFEMYINPDQLQIRYPTRSQVIQTISGAYIDSFGYGLPTGVIEGSFGWGQDQNLATGLDRMGTLKKLYHEWQRLTTTLATPVQMLLPGNANTDRLNILAHLGDLTITSSKGSPLTISYSLNFTVLRDYNGPINPQVLPPIGTITSDGGTPDGGDRRRPN